MFCMQSVTLLVSRVVFMFTIYSYYDTVNTRLWFLKLWEFFSIGRCVGLVVGPCIACDAQRNCFLVLYYAWDTLILRFRYWLKLNIKFRRCFSIGRCVGLAIALFFSCDASRNYFLVLYYAWDALILWYRYCSRLNIKLRRCFKKKANIEIF